MEIYRNTRSMVDILIKAKVPGFSKSCWLGPLPFFGNPNFKRAAIDVKMSIINDQEKQIKEAWHKAGLSQLRERFKILKLMSINAASNGYDTLLCASLSVVFEHIQKAKTWQIARMYLRNPEAWFHLLP